MLFVNVLGVADGVGGWRHYGIDPGEFSSFLMRTCERLVSMGRFTPSEPAGLLARSYYELLENKQPILGTEYNVSKVIVKASIRLKMFITTVQSLK